MGSGHATWRGAHVTIIALLIIIGIAQSVFLGGIVVMLMANRRRSTRRRASAADASAEVNIPLQTWLVGEGTVEPVARALERLPLNRAFELAIIIATSRAARSQRAEFSAAIRDAAWVQVVLHRARSRRWWRRLDAARLLAIVGTPRDRDLLHRLLDDPHPAVQGLAVASIPVVADMDAIGLLLARLPARSLVVRLYQFSVLRDIWWLATPALLECLTPDASASSLETWINLAEVIATPELLERVRSLRDHPDPVVRLAIARALRRYFHPAAEEALITLLRDDDWRVRAIAARSLGTLGDAAAVPLIAPGLRDSHWWVRFRCGLALAQLGETGRAALRDVRRGDDRYAAEMATMISGLSPGSVVELAEG